MNFTIAALDAKRQSAQIVGNAGAVFVSFFPFGGKAHFIETTDSGNLTITTVILSREQTDTLTAVHSRHIYLTGGDFLVSQKPGTCTPKF